MRISSMKSNDYCFFRLENGMHWCTSHDAHIGCRTHNFIISTLFALFTGAAVTIAEKYLKFQQFSIVNLFAASTTRMPSRRIMMGNFITTFHCECVAIAIHCISHTFVYVRVDFFCAQNLLMIYSAAQENGAFSAFHRGICETKTAFKMIIINACSRFGYLVVLIIVHFKCQGSERLFNKFTAEFDI